MGEVINLQHEVSQIFFHKQNGSAVFMRARVGKVSACTHADTGASMSIPPQAFLLGRPGLKDERRRHK